MTPVLAPARAVSAAEAAAALPYPGEDPGALDAIGSRITDAILALATVADVIDHARTALPGAWRGTAARTGSAEIQRVRHVLTEGSERLYRARSAVFGCADDLREVRSLVDRLRLDWRRAEGSVRALDVALAVELDPARHLILDDQRAAGAVRRGLAERAGSAAVVQADRATTACRASLTAAISGEQVYVAGRGVVTADLGTAVGVTAMVSDDHFRSALAGMADDETRWTSLGAAARAFALATAGTFPAATDSPALRSAWWTSRSWTEQQAVLHAAPAVVGAADGVPTRARDQANRLFLDGRDRELQDALDVGDPSLAGVRIDVLDPGVFLGGAAAARGAALGALQREKNTISRIREQLASERSRPLYLMGVGPGGRGQAIVAIGDPDTAAHVATYVPGTASDVGGLGGELDRVDAWVAGAGQADTGSTAAVVWLGYESPPDLLAAARDSAADAAGPALATFQQGLRAGHQGAPSRNVVVGHSYGALVLAAASTGDQELAADGLIFVAPVGLEVGSVTDLHLVGVPPEEMGDRVLTVMHRNDLIQASSVVHPGAPYAPSFGARVVITGRHDADNAWWMQLAGLPGAVVDDAYAAHGDYSQDGSAEQRTISDFLVRPLR